MTRRLASIQKVEWIKPAQNSDNLDIVGILGWQCVSKRGTFVKDELVVFCEVDSILPKDALWAQFMAPRNFRVKTIKLRGNLSQGLVFPLEILPDDDQFAVITEKNVGEDVTDVLKVTKYESSIHDSFKNGISKGSFPSHLVPKTDEIRIQSCLGVLNEISGYPYCITIKCDGTSATYLYSENNEFTICSRNTTKKEVPSNTYWEIAKKYNIAEKLLKYSHLAIQGEICGPNIQKNRLNLDEADLFVFNVYNIDEKKYLDYPDFVVLTESLGLKTVPVLDVCASFNLSLEKLLDLAEGKYEKTDNEREGIVVRPIEEMWSNTLQGRLSFKVISNSFLLNE